LRQHRHHPRSDFGHLNLAQFKPQGFDEGDFFGIGLTVPEKRCLAEMVEELFAPLRTFWPTIFSA
jgi:hypothetical protein